MTEDKSCSIAPYFKAHPGKLGELKALCGKLIEKTRTEPGCLYYTFTFSGDLMFCREAYTDAEAMLAHVESVDGLIQEALKISDLARVEVHGPEEELAKLRGPLAGLTPQFFTLETGFRR